MSHFGHGGGRFGREWRNEANLRVRRLVLRGYQDGVGLGFGAGGASGCGFFGLEAAELVEGIMVVALGGIDAALEAGEFVGLLGEDLAEGDVVDVDDALPELGLDDAETAEEPLAIDEGIDEHGPLGGGGAEAVVIFADEFLEVGPDFAANELGFGVDAGFEGIHGGVGLAVIGAGSGRFFRVETIG